MPMAIVNPLERKKLCDSFCINNIFVIGRRLCITIFADEWWRVDFFCRQTWAKWFCRPQFLHVFRKLGKLKTVHRQLQDRTSSLGFRCFSLSARLLYFSALISSSAPGDFFSSLRRMFVISPLLPISIARDNVSFSLATISFHFPWSIHLWFPALADFWWVSRWDNCRNCTSRLRELS